MSEKSSFRSLLGMSDKIAREELGDYYVMGASRMHNMLDCLEDGAKQIQKLTDENVWLRKNLEATAGEYDDALGKIARLQVDLHQTVVDFERYRLALQQIAYFHDTKDVVWSNEMRAIAKAALEI